MEEIKLINYFLNKIIKDLSISENAYTFRGKVNLIFDYLEIPKKVYTHEEKLKLIIEKLEIKLVNGR